MGLMRSAPLPSRLNGGWGEWRSGFVLEIPSTSLRLLGQVRAEVKDKTDKVSDSEERGNKEAGPGAVPGLMEIGLVPGRSLPSRLISCVGEWRSGFVLEDCKQTLKLPMAGASAVPELMADTGD
jgi:hypothetical protein